MAGPTPAPRLHGAAPRTVWSGALCCAVRSGRVRLRRSARRGRVPVAPSTARTRSRSAA
ncbi:hypothetical protein ACFFX0_19765 [Citricoccus parietis]|uniref:Uncharacterized protein n=1 Tax=Citricoccus parietis TaxID=592307 RepID=A0ABV5G305_9MICC